MNIYLNLIKKIINSAAKIFLFIGVLILIISLFFAFSTKNKNKISYSKITKDLRAEIYKNINDKKFNSTENGKKSIAWYRLINCVSIGEACTDNPDDGDKNYNSSMFGFVGKAIALPYLYQPASGIYWVQDALENANIIPKSYAAEGIGFSALQPIIGLWKIFRNVAYSILVFILIGIGFLIIFRVKINPQTIISLENSLPKIIITLLLITFSYPIAGLMIDLTYLVMALGIIVFSNYINVQENLGVLSGNGWSLFDKVFWNGGIWEIGFAFMEIIPFSVALVLSGLIVFVSGIVITHLPWFKELTQGTPTQNTSETGNITSVISATVVGLIFMAILSIAVPIILSLLVFTTALVVFFRIFFLLLKSYIKILLLIIFAPVIVLLEAIPGKKMFLVWIKHLFSNLIAFPIVSTLIIISTILMNLQNESRLWKPPFLISTSTDTIILLVSIGILFLIPDIVKIVRGVFGIKEEALKPGSGLFFGGAMGAASTAFSPLQKLGSLAYGFNAIKQTKIGQKILNLDESGKPKKS